MKLDTTRIKGFKTVYATKAGKTVARDVVEICQVGQGDRSVTPLYISEFERLRPIMDPVNDIAAIQQHALWDLIRPAYEAWKKGQDLPDNGTPLAAWPGVTREQVDILKGNGYRTVEELAAVTDSALARIQLPGARNLVEQAKAFLQAADKSKVAAELAQKDEQIRALNADIEDLKNMVENLIAENKPRRGRPPKSEDIEAA